MCALSGILTFRKSGTTVDPRYPEKASELVKIGIYTFSRNPMYLGMLFVLTGIALYLGALSGFFIIPLFVLYMNYFQIMPEERILQEVFGEDFGDYRQKVRRWI